MVIQNSLNPTLCYGQACNKQMIKLGVQTMEDLNTRNTSFWHQHEIVQFY